MCCIFTCCGWVIDLVQRFWVFAMSCCISGAITCTLITASMAGIAMGYNYSLAEYIDLKETNVSVYLKRGVFDDDIADDMEWRRSGHLPVSGHLNDQNLQTGAELDYASTNVPYGRRMDDSIFQSDDHHKYEGSLMKLTMKPVYDTPTPAEYSLESNPTHPIQEINENAVLPHGLDELKNQQAIINRRKSMSQRLQTARRNMGPETTIVHDERDFPLLPDTERFPTNYARRQMDQVIRQSLQGHEFGASARDQVPGRAIGLKHNWLDPKLPPHQQMPRDDNVFLEPVTYPPPITLRQGPLRPSRPPPPKTYPTHTSSFAEPSSDDNLYKIPSLQDYKKKFEQDILRADKQDTSDEEDELAKKLKQGKGSLGEEYDEEFKGLPVRRRRHIKTERKFRTISESANNNSKSKLLHNGLFKLFNIKENTNYNRTVETPQHQNLVSRNEIKEEVNIFNKIN